MVCKNAKSAVESEKGLLFGAIRVRLDMIIDKHGLKSVPNAFNFKVKNRIRLPAFPCVVGYIVKTTQRCVCSFLVEDIFKAGVNIKTVQNLGTVHACPYVGEVTTKFRGGDWVDSCQADLFHQMIKRWDLKQEQKPNAPNLTKESKVHLKGDDNSGKGVGRKRRSLD
jgi:hypothetical protein